MKTSKKGIDFIKGFENLELKPYIDIAGVPTIGYGHVLKVYEQSQFQNGISEAKAEELLAEDLKVAEDWVNRNVKVDLEQNQFDALVSMVFNLGSAPKTVALINDRASEEAIREEWMTGVYYRKNGKLKVANGLVRRRKEELEMFYTPTLYSLKKTPGGSYSFSPS